MEKYTKDNIKTIKDMAQVHSFGLMEINMLEIGNMENRTEKEKLLNLMEQSNLVFGMMVYQ